MEPQVEEAVLGRMYLQWPGLRIIRDNLFVKQIVTLCQTDERYGHYLFWSPKLIILCRLKLHLT